jgi:hypothetical protein
VGREGALIQGTRRLGSRVARALAPGAIPYFSLGALLHYVLFPEEEPPECGAVEPRFAGRIAPARKAGLISVSCVISNSSPASSR